MFVDFCDVYKQNHPYPIVLGKNTLCHCRQFLNTSREFCLFAAAENGVEPVKSAVEIEKEIRTEYDSKLKVDDIIIPDESPHKWGSTVYTNYKNN